MVFQSKTVKRVSTHQSNSSLITETETVRSMSFSPWWDRSLQNTADEQPLTALSEPKDKEAQTSHARTGNHTRYLPTALIAVGQVLLEWVLSVLKG